MGQTALYYQQQLIQNHLSETRFHAVIKEMVNDVRSGTKINVVPELLPYFKDPKKHAWVVKIPTQDLGTLLEQIDKPSITLKALTLIVQNYRARNNIMYLRKSRESQALACELDTFLATVSDKENLSDCSGLFIFELFHILKSYMETYIDIKQESSEKILCQQLISIYKELQKSIAKFYPLYQVYYQKGDGQYSALIRAARVIKAYEEDERWFLQRSSESLYLIDGEFGLKQTLASSTLQPANKESTLLNLYSTYAAKNHNRTFYEAFAPVKQDLLDTDGQRKGVMPSYS